MPDLSPWAQLVADLIEPGGTFYLNEFHPAIQVFDGDDLTLVRDYFGRREGYEDNDGESYVENDRVTTSTRPFEWSHPLSDVVGSLISTGFTIELLNGQDFTVYQRFPRGQGSRPSRGTPLAEIGNRRCKGGAREFVDIVTA
ncbi:MAG: hypothetical protein CL933_02035 [Deltaproteobacteria bacterium]|nr:hypothetical protein [Deltaproteobacteria bacterium]